MQIQPTGKSSGVGPSSPAHTGPSASVPAKAGADHVDFSMLSQVAAGLPRQRIEELQNQVNSGAYDVNAQEVSRHIVDFYSIPL